jgi:hypothetical protein
VNEEVSEHIYQLYRGAKRLIERTEGCCEKDHSDEPLFIEWKEAIRIFDGLGRGYAERYEKEKNNESVV